MGVNHHSSIARLMIVSITVVLLMAGLSAFSEVANNPGVMFGSLRAYAEIHSSPPLGSPEEGTVDFKPEFGKPKVVDVGRGGKFSVKLEPGNYTVFGGPRIWHNSCLAHNGKSITLRGGQHLRVIVACVAI